MTTKLDEIRERIARNNNSIVHEGDDRALVEDRAHLLQQVDELEQTFNLRWDADQRAIKRWREAHSGNELVMPDHADLVVWLMEQHEKTRIILAHAEWWDREAMQSALREVLEMK